ncbi:MAG: hypothetical protein LIO86_12160 [Lachnospiraceae bacterium]|nr:hypothetical protein [Lachnospiraceae bacterium]
MKHGMKRTLAALLAAVMVFTSVDITGLAAGTEDSASIETEADENEELVTSDGDGTVAEAEAGESADETEADAEESAAGTEMDAEEASDTSEEETNEVSEEADEQETEEESAGVEEEIVTSTVEASAEVGQYAEDAPAELSNVGTYGQLALFAEYGAGENGESLSEGVQAVLKSEALEGNDENHQVIIQAYDQAALVSAGKAEWKDGILYLYSYTTNDGTKTWTWSPESASDGTLAPVNGTDSTWTVSGITEGTASLTVTYSATYTVSYLANNPDIFSNLQENVKGMATILEGDGAAQWLYENRTEINELFDALNDYGDSLFEAEDSKEAITVITNRMNGNDLRLYTWLSPIAGANSPVAAYCLSSSRDTVLNESAEFELYTEQAKTLASALRVLQLEKSSWNTMMSYASQFGVTEANVETLIINLESLADLSGYSISDYLKDGATSSEVASLIAAVQAMTTIDIIDDTSLSLTQEYKVAASDKATVTVKLVIENADGSVYAVYATTAVISFDTGVTSQTLSEADVDLGALVSGLEESFNGVNTYLQKDGTIYYELKSDDLDSETSISQGGTLTFTRTYTPQSFTVWAGDEKIEFATGINFTGYSFTLPEVKDGNGAVVDGYYYTYESDEISALINGKESGDEATISLSDLQGIAGDYSLTLKRSIYKEETDIYADFVADVNSSLADVDGIVLLMQTGKDEQGADAVESIVLRLSPSSSLTVSDLMEAATEAFADVVRDLSYIEIDGKTFYEQNTVLDLQVLANLFLNEESINSDDIIAAINEDGTIKTNLSFEGKGIVVSADGENSYDSELGGTFVDSTFSIEKDDSDPKSFYVTLAPETENQKEYMKQMRRLVSALEKRGVTFATNQTDPDKPGLTVDFDMTSTSSDRTLYKLYLAVLAMTDQIDLSALAEEDNEMATLAEQAQALLNADDGVLREVLTSEGLSADTLQNTLDALGVSSTLDLAQYANVIDPLLKRVRNLVNGKGNLSINGVTFDEALQNMKSDTESLSFNLVYDTEPRISSMFSNSEYSVYTDLLNKLLSGEAYFVKVPITLTLTADNSNYAAIVMDMGASGATNKVTLATKTNLSTVLADAQGTTLVWLQSDVDDDLVFNTQTILNLNGYTIEGDIEANAALRIVDTIMSDEDVGGVIGTISGSNVRIAAGYYTYDVSDYCSGAYEWNETTHYVVNQYYTLTKDESGDLTIELSADIADIAEENLQMIAMEIATDLIFEFYSSASLTISGGGLDEDADIYSVAITDLVKTYADGSTLEELMKSMLDCVEEAGTNAVINDLIQRLSDYSSLATAAKTGGDIVRYTLTTEAYQISAYIADEGTEDAYITADITAKESDEPKVQTVTVKFAKANNDLGYMFDNLATVVTPNDVNVIFSSPSYSTEDGFSLNCDIYADVEVDLSNGENASLYAEILAVLLANTMDADSPERENLINYIRLYADGYDQTLLKKEIDQITIGKLEEMLTQIGDKSFADIVESLGLADVLTEAVTLESYYYTVLKIARDLTTRMENIMDDSARVSAWYDRTLGNTEEDGDYTYDGEDFNTTLSVTRTILGQDMKMVGTLDVSGALTIFSKEYVEKFEQLIAALDALKETYWDAETGEVDSTKAALLIIDRQKVIGYLTTAQDLYNSFDEDILALFKQYYPLYATAYTNLLAAFTNTATEETGTRLGLWVEDIDPLVYTGSAQKPHVLVHDGLDTLVEGVDYKISWSNNTNATRMQEPIDSMTQSVTGGNYARVKITFTSKSNFKGTIYQYFIINPINLDYVGNNTTYILVSDDDLDTTAVTPYPEVDGNGDVVYRDANGETNADGGYVRYYFDSDLNETGGTTYEDYYGLTVSDVYRSYTASSYGKPTIKLNGKTMSSSLFDFSYSETYPTKKADREGFVSTITVSAKARSGVQNFVSGSSTTATHYSGYLISKVTVKNKKSSYKYGSIILADLQTGEGTALKVYYGSKLLEYEKDYTIEGVEYDSVGTWKITIKGVEETVKNADGSNHTPIYFGTKTVSIKITGTALKSSWFTILNKTKDYDFGNAIELTYGTDYTEYNASGDPLTEGTDFVVSSYKSNKNKGTATVTIKGAGQYSGTIKKTFKIVAIDMSKVSAVVNGTTISSFDGLNGLETTYTKGGVTTGLTDQIKLVYGNQTLVLGTHYTVSFKSNTKTGTAQYRIVGKGGFTGNLGWRTFTIKAASLGDLAETATVSDKLYSKSASNNYMPSVTIKDTNGKTLKSGTDYYSVTSLSYTTYQTTETTSGVSGIDYTGDTGTITAKKLNLSNWNWDDNGGRFTISITILGKGNYAGSTLTKEYDLYQYSLKNATVILQDNGGWAYGVTKGVPGINVRYKVNGEWKVLTRSVYDEDEGTWSDGDYIITYDTDESILYQLAGVHTATITGTGQYGGTRKVVYTVQRVTAIKSVLNGKEAAYKLLLSYYSGN